MVGIARVTTCAYYPNSRELTCQVADRFAPISLLANRSAIYLAGDPLYLKAGPTTPGSIPGDLEQRPCRVHPARSLCFQQFRIKNSVLPKILYTLCTDTLSYNTKCDRTGYKSTRPSRSQIRHALLRQTDKKAARAGKQVDHS
jgi:hypothetical protein